MKKKLSLYKEVLAGAAVFLLLAGLGIWWGTTGNIPGVIEDEYHAVTSQAEGKLVSGSGRPDSRPVMDSEGGGTAGEDPGPREGQASGEDVVGNHVDLSGETKDFWRSGEDKQSGESSRGQVFGSAEGSSSKVSFYPIWSSSPEIDKPSPSKPYPDISSSSSASQFPGSKPGVSSDSAPEPTQEEKNNAARNQAQQKYGVSIRYADELPNYRPRGEDPARLSDAEDVSEALADLDRVLSRYPAGFFKEMRDFGMPITFYLVKNIPSGAFVGLTDKEFGDDIRITLSTEGFLERTAHHEIMHYVEAYLDIKLYPDEPFPNWMQMNPSGFNYGNTDSSYVYNMLHNKYGAYFVNSYGKTNALEDRATIFEDIMSRAYAPEGCYAPGEVVRRKAETIVGVIQQNFACVTAGTSQWWNRLLQ